MRGLILVCVFSLLLSVLLFSSSVISQTGDVTWSGIGLDNYSIKDIVVDPSNPSTIYAATYPGGVFKTTNSGGSWIPINIGTSASGVLELEIDRLNPATVYAGTSGGSIGIYKTTNGGVSWNPANNGLPESLGSQSLAIAPSNSSIIYAAVDALFGSTRPTGIYKTTNAGGSWNNVLTGESYLTVTVDHSNSNIIYAGSDNAHVYKTTSGGISWSRADAGIRQIFTSIQTLVVDPVSSNIIYAGVQYLGNGVIYKTTNGGISWSDLRFDHTTSASAVAAIAIDPRNPQTIYAGTPERGVFKSNDAGENWQAINAGLPRVNLLYRNIQVFLISPSSSSLLYVGGETGIYKGVYAACMLSCDATVPSSGGINTSIPFASTASTTGCSGGVSYDWDFGDSTAHSAQQNPTHSYTRTGTFNWSLTVSVSGASTCVKTGSITIIQGGGQANNNCANAINLTQNNCPFNTTLSTIGASEEQNEPTVCSTIGGTVWYSFTNTSANSLDVTVSLCGSNYDTVVNVYDANGAGCAFTNFTVAACNDDFCSLQSQATFTANPGRFYKIQVGGFAGQAGNLSISITIAQGCTLSCTGTVPTSTIVNNSISFAATASASGCSGVPTYSWDFGDGTSLSSQQNPVHTYTRTGTFNWRLTVSVSGASSCVRSGSITITPGTLYNSQFISQTVPTTVGAGQQFTANIKYTNTGTQLWGGVNFYLASQNPTLNQTWGGNSVSLTNFVMAPGQQLDLSFTALAPLTPGTYNFQWQLYQLDGVGFFGQRSDNVVIQVVPIDQTGLRELAERRNFNIGAAVRIRDPKTGQPGCPPTRDLGPFYLDGSYTDKLRRNFNVIVAENEFKFSEIHPQENCYFWEDADDLVRFAQANGMKVRGHALIWHDSVPDWLKNGNFTRNELIRILQDHIRTVVSRYRGKIWAWDVVNEAIADDTGKLRGDTGSNAKSFWYEKLGGEYIPLAFQAAYEADPSAKLYYNDYGIEDMGTKSNAVNNLVSQLQTNRIPIHGVGWQMHVKNGFRILPVHRENAQRLADKGLDISVTELDVRIDLPTLTTSEKLNIQAKTYADILAFCLTRPNCKALVMWGFTDRHSWISEDPCKFAGDGDALIFDKYYADKPAYNALKEVLQSDGKPIITSASVSGKKLFVYGESFGSEARVILNGISEKTSSSNQTTLIAKKSGKKITPGQAVRLQVLNPDGKISDEFIFTQQHCSIEFNRNPVEANASSCNGGTGTSWIFGVTLSTSAGTGVTISSFKIDYYDRQGGYSKTVTLTDNIFMAWFTNCGTGSKYIAPGAMACASLCYNPGTSYDAAIVMTFYGTDELGRNVVVTSEKLVFQCM